MKIGPALLASVALSLAACSKQETSTTSKPPSGNPVTAPVDYLGAVSKARNASAKVIDSATINRAIQLFYAEEDRFPRDLNELVASKYLPSVPAAPPGTRWAYNPRTGAIQAVQAQ